MSGYSGRPLAKKLSLKDGMRVWWDGMPDGARENIEAEGLQLRLVDVPDAPLDAAHIFVTERTDITEDVIRHVALPLGFVDIKVCAVDDVWSGLKLVVRKELR